MTHILPNGDLYITANNRLRSEIAYALKNQGYHGAESYVAESLHERYEFISPEVIGALTDSPILTDDPDFSDEWLEKGVGTGVCEGGKVWWFPNYMIDCPWTELARKGRVVFTLAM